MKTAMLIWSHPGEHVDNAIRRHWPYFKRGGVDIIGCGRTDGVNRWPDSVPTVAIGRQIEGHWHDDHENLPMRLVNTFRWCLQSSVMKDYDAFFLIDWDVIMIHPVPEYVPGSGLVTTVMCGGQPAFKGSFASCHPWYMDRETAARFVAGGDALIELHETEKGTPDYFTGLICDRYQIPVTKFNGFVVNTIDNPTYVKYARDAIAAGCLLVHGVKTQAQLDTISDLL